MQKIVVGFDGSDGATAAVTLASSIAAASGASISIVWVVPEARASRSAWGVLALGPADELDRAVHEAAAEEIEEVVTRLRGQGIACEGVVRPGEAPQALADEAEAERADLLVVGCRGFGPIRSTLLGSVSQSVTHLAHCPVLVARHTTISGALLAADGSEGALEAERILGVLPGAGRVPVRVLSVAEVQHPLASGISPTVLHAALEAHVAYVIEAKAAHAQIAEAAAERLRAMGADATTAVRVGDPAVEVIEEAAACGADLIVLGSRGLTGLKRLVLGSVATKVLQHAHASVLVAR